MQQCSHHGTGRSFVHKTSCFAVNLSGDKSKRDLGGLLLLMVFMIVRQTWWLLAPLLEELVPEHPIFTSGFMQEIRISGV